MDDLVSNLLTYSKLASAGHASSSPVEISHVLNWSLANLAKEVEDSGASIEKGDLPVVAGDPVQLAQLFQHLISNALKYRDANPPSVRISAEPAGGQWLFRITDNGGGIDSRYHERIFGLFKRLHGRDVPGSGMGLAICRRIVERHGGRIWVESERGRGSTFLFTLSAIESAPSK
jgi:light-regulated signal transduction histidine kinase (bacteriophytochrome)